MKKIFFLALLLFSIKIYAYPGEEWDLKRTFYLKQFDDLLNTIKNSATNKEKISRIFDRNGVLISEIYSGPSYVLFDKIPLHLIDAIVQMEDKNFFHHSGIDFKGMMRAIIHNLKKGKIVEGGSTLTQQLAKLLFTEGERTFSRKAFDIRASLELEDLYSKEDILLIYLNKVFFGHSCFGVEEASRFYFKKHVENLTIAESALLAGLLTSPNTVSPFNNPELAKQKQKIVLQKLKEIGYSFDIERLQNEFWDRYSSFYSSRYISLKPLIKDEEPLWTAIAEYEIKKLFPDIEDGFTAVLSVDLNLQKILKEETEDWMKNKGYLTNQLETASILLDAKTGEILAMVNGTSFRPDNQFNRAMQMKRPIGSLIKPFLYAACFEKKILTKTNILSDSPISIKLISGKWNPKNYDKKFVGDITVEEALRQSRNIPAVRALLLYGVSDFCDFLKRVWNEPVAENMKEMPSIILGTIEMSVLQIAEGYTVLATEGKIPSPISSKILRTVTDKNGEFILDTLAERIRNIFLSTQINEISKDACKEVTDILKRVTEKEGTAFEAANEAGFSNNGTTACKTGTTSNFRDAWTVIYDKDFVLAVWIGYDRKTEPLPGAGGRLAGPLAFKIWKRIKKIN